MSVTFYNDIDFKIEDAYSALLTAVASNLVGSPIVLGLSTDALEVTHIAIIVEKLDQADDSRRTGNWKGFVKIKVVTAIDDSVPDGFLNLRAVHRQRCGIVRDTIMVSTLDADLSAQATDFSVVGFQWDDISHRVEGRSWVSEMLIFHPSICGTDV